MKHRLFAALLLAGVMLTAASGCGESSSDVITENEMPYGSTLVKKIADGKPTLQYDDRFVPEECLDTVVKYYDCIAQNDVETFKAIQLPLYHDYQLNKVLEGKYTDEEILGNTHDELMYYVGGKFRFTMLDITDCTRKKPQSDLDNLITLLDSVWTDNGSKGKFSDDISDARTLTITRYLAKEDSQGKGETNTAMKDEKLYVLKYQSQWYVLYN